MYKNLNRLRQFLILAFMLITAFVKAQTLTITGNVVDEKHLSLPGATVFLTGTQSITATDISGKFKLERLAPGTYQLIVKMVGFMPYIQSVKLGAIPVNVNIKLSPSVALLKEVKIHPDYDRAKHLALFKKEFLGQTYNAALCKLTNPDILFFNYDKKTKILTATADEFLIVQNNGLGYKIKYLLTDFEFNENNNIVTYQGYPSFEQMPGTEKQQALWYKNRKIAYLGSINHFMRSVYSNRVYQEGFNVYKLLNRPILGIQPDTGAKKMLLVEEPVMFDSLLTVKNKDLKTLTFKDCLYVVYKNEPEPANFTEGSYTIKKVPTTEIAHHGQASLVYLLVPSVEIDSNGLYNPTNGLFFEAYWAWEKNADLMPLEYSVPVTPK
jgi:hypothetical protein